jgi:hypothetical protein
MMIMMIMTSSVSLSPNQQMQQISVVNPKYIITAWAICKMSPIFCNQKNIFNTLYCIGVKHFLCVWETKC